MRIKHANNGGVPTPKRKTITLIDVEYVDWDNFPARGADGITITGDIPLLEGYTPDGIDADRRTISRKDVSDGEGTSKGIRQEITFEFPGRTAEMDSHVQNNLNKEFLMITQDCADGQGTLLHGTECNPVELNFDEQDDQEAVKKMLTYTSVQKGKFKAAHYQGVVPSTEEGSGGGGI